MLLAGSRHVRFVAAQKWQPCPICNSSLETAVNASGTILRSRTKPIPQHLHCSHCCNANLMTLGEEIKNGAVNPGGGGATNPARSSFRCIFFYRPETVMACCGEQSVHRNHPQLAPPPPWPQVNRNDRPLHGRRLPTRAGRNYDTIESATLLVVSDTSNCELPLLEKWS